MKTLKFVLIDFMSLILLVSFMVIYKLYKKNVFIWLYDYTFNSPSFEETNKLTDIIFVVSDHWEPGGRMDIINAWMTGYRKLADKHIDADGYKLQHTFFYPIDQFCGYEIDSAVQLCREGYGDVEVHLHHKNDNSESLRKKFEDGLDSLQAHGALLSYDGEDHWAFVHGNWALDNSRLENGENFCGVNDEITILLDLGCYADFTFPSIFHVSQPPFVNKVFYAQDDPNEQNLTVKG